MQVRLDPQGSGVRAESHDVFNRLLNLRPRKAKFGARDGRKLIQYLHSNRSAAE
jgi:hypothetical protein